MKRSGQSLDDVFEAQIQILAITLRPHTIANYRFRVRKFLAYLHASFSRLHEAAPRNARISPWIASNTWENNKRHCMCR